MTSSATTEGMVGCMQNVAVEVGLILKDLEETAVDGRTSGNGNGNGHGSESEQRSARTPAQQQHEQRKKWQQPHEQHEMNEYQRRNNDFTSGGGGGGGSSNSTSASTAPLTAASSSSSSSSSSSTTTTTADQPSGPVFSKDNPTAVTSSTSSSAGIEVQAVGLDKIDDSTKKNGGKRNRWDKTKNVNTKITKKSYHDNNKTNDDSEHVRGGVLGWLSRSTLPINDNSAKKDVEDTTTILKALMHLTANKKDSSGKASAARAASIDWYQEDKNDDALADKSATVEQDEQKRKRHHRQPQPQQRPPSPVMQGLFQWDGPARSQSNSSASTAAKSTTIDIEKLGGPGIEVQAVGEAFDKVTISTGAASTSGGAADAAADGSSDSPTKTMKGLHQKRLDDRRRLIRWMTIICIAVVFVLLLAICLPVVLLRDKSANNNGASSSTALEEGGSGSVDDDLDDDEDEILSAAPTTAAPTLAPTTAAPTAAPTNVLDRWVFGNCTSAGTGSGLLADYTCEEDGTATIVFAYCFAPKRDGDWYWVRSLAADENSGEYDYDSWSYTDDAEGLAQFTEIPSGTTYVVDIMRDSMSPYISIATHNIAVPNCTAATS